MRKKYPIIFCLSLIIFSVGLISINFDLDIKEINDNPITLEMMGNIFIDDFEDGSLVADWTISGSGDGDVDTYTSNSGIYSAFHRGGAGSITSRTFDLSMYSSVRVSYWVQKGSDAFSEFPENNEDFTVEYNSSSGDWIELDYFEGGGQDNGEIFVRNHLLPLNAMHSDFQIRFRQTRGTNGDWDYWHFDDVKIILPNLNSPTLSNDYLNATSGNSNDYFNFSIEYIDIDYDQPNYIRCVINDTIHDMVPIDPSDNDYTDGKAYEFITPLPGGKYIYYFEAFDGKFYVRYPETGYLTGPTVSSINLASPNLISYPVSPLIGHESTQFKFNAKYSDPDNNPPSQVNITINSIQYNMVKKDINDINYIDGCYYVLSKTYTNSETLIYYYNASDGSNQVGSKIFNNTIGVWHLNNFQMTKSGDIYSFDVQIDNFSYIYQVAVRINYPDKDFKEYHLLYNRISKNDTSKTNFQWDASKVGSGTLTVDLVITDIAGNIIIFNNIKTINNPVGMDFILPTILVIVILAVVFLVGALYIIKYQPKLKIKQKKKQTKGEIPKYKVEEPIYQREVRTLPQIYEQRPVPVASEMQAKFDKCPYCNTSLPKSTIDKIKNGYRVYCPSDNCRNLLS